jgi:hypothetical protein
VGWTEFMGYALGWWAESCRPGSYIYIELPEGRGGCRISSSALDVIRTTRRAIPVARTTALMRRQDLAQLTGYHRGCAWDEATEQWQEEPQCAGIPITPLERYVQRPDVLVIRHQDLKEA